MRRIILIIFLFSIFLHSNDFDIEVDENLETKLKPSVFDDEMNLTKLSTMGYISIFSKSLNKGFKLKVDNSLVAIGIIPLAKDWKLKDNNLKFSNILENISLLGYGNYMGEGEKKEEEKYKCLDKKLSIINTLTENKRLFIVAINKDTNKFYQQYYGDYKEVITFENCIESNTYTIKRRLFDTNYEIRK